FPILAERDHGPAAREKSPPVNRKPLTRADCCRSLLQAIAAHSRDRPAFFLLAPYRSAPNPEREFRALPGIRLRPGRSHPVAGITGRVISGTDSCICPLRQFLSDKALPQHQTAPP